MQAGSGIDALSRLRGLFAPWGITAPPDALPGVLYLSARWRPGRATKPPQTLDPAEPSTQTTPATPSRRWVVRHLYESDHGEGCKSPIGNLAYRLGQADATLVWWSPVTYGKQAPHSCGRPRATNSLHCPRAAMPPAGWASVVG
jgi:hypothetical protein